MAKKPSNKKSKLPGTGSSPSSVMKVAEVLPQQPIIDLKNVTEVPKPPCNAPVERVN